jgi:two-component sensor histidine kinase/PAS domain-containing protein
MTNESDLDLDLDLDAWRDRVLSRVLRIVVVVAAVAALGGIALSIRERVYAIAVFDALAWIGLLAISRGRMAYRLRALAMVGLNFIVGVVILGVLGPSGAGHLWLIGAPITAALLLGRRGFVAALAASELTLVGFGLAAWAFNPWPAFPAGLLWWILVTASVAFVSLLVGLPTLELLDGLEASLGVRARARDLARKREREQSALRAQFELLFAESPAALMLVDPSGMVVRRNVQAQRLFGFGERESAPLEALLGPQALAAAGKLCEDSSREQPTDRPSAPAFDETIEGRSLSGRTLMVATRITAIRLEDRTHALVGAVDVSERVAAQTALQHALGEKVTLLQEVHHRVKNNLQVVSSLLGLQADRGTSREAREALIESTHRVRTMALIHQQLYAGESFSRIEFGAYARTLVSELCAALDPNARITFELAPVELVLANALPCGLILNELVTNSLKHGRSPDGLCRITVSVQQVDGRLALEVRDEGAGLSSPWREVKRRSLGGSIIDALVRQLRATLEVDSSPAGARFRLSASTEPDEGPRLSRPATLPEARAAAPSVRGEAPPASAQDERPHDGTDRAASKTL